MAERKKKEEDFGELLKELGTVTKKIKEALELPEGSGDKTVEEMRIYGVVPVNYEEGVERTLVNFEDKAEGLALPDFDPQAVLALMERSKRLNPFLQKLELETRRLTQAQRILDGEAWKQMRMLYDFLKIHAKHHPEVAARFEDFFEMFKRPSRAKKEEPKGDES